MKKSLPFFILLILISAFTVSCSSSEGRTNDLSNDSIHVDTLQKYPNTGEIKIMSFNVRYETNEEEAIHNWDFRKEACVDMIEDQRPTLIGFQEAVYTSQWSYLKEHLANKYDGFGVGREDGLSKGECMGILYRTDDVEKLRGGTFWLSDTPDIPSKGWGSSFYRSATWGIFKLKSTGQYFIYINTHLDLTSNVRCKEMELIVKKFAEYNPKEYLQFLTADFNTTPNDDIFKDLKMSMSNARDNALKTDYSNTFNGWGDGTGLIDDIFYSKSLTAIEYHTITQGYDGISYLSDHYPIYAIIKF